ncbi:helix-turn-helix domain-containing protein [Streptomyces kronopolitis]|uniref:helix-turn-helix domain-containing protein n=1 Tax=Streptomyces kronopolitis TaxID=1612435 RepID=UPI0020BFDCCD|nr:helix-turn-helix transcriptional regulator [Streptomyces kronopolitis]MCL6297546.1 helix-turn-helix transcriptional regulator [Streptomyces kronopolitis]
MTAYQPATALPRELLSRNDVRAAISAHDFGLVFRIARSEAGISYSKIATECDIKPERVGALARGHGSVTTFEKIAKIADALRIPGDMLGLAPRVWESVMQSGSPPVVPAHTTTESRDGEDTVRRREFFKASAGTGLAVGLPEFSQINIGRRIGHDAPDQLRKRTARLRRLDEILGGGDTYRVYLGEQLATKRLMRECDYGEQTRLALLSVLAEQAQQAGWAAFDGGNHADARSLYEDSYRAATQAGDTALAGNALAFLAYQQISGDREAGIGTALTACRTAGPDAPPGVRALLHERLAWAYAVAGQVHGTEQALNDAETALNEHDGTLQPDWASWVDHNELQIMTGRCWTELRRPLRAVPVLEDALAKYEDTHARDKSLYLSWLADSYMSAGEIEQAASTARRSLELSAGVASVRPRQRIQPTLRRLSSHRELPAVAAVLELAQG